MAANEKSYENATENKLPITVVDMPSFTREASKIFSDAELERVRDHVSQFRELGAIIKDTGGLRKLRWHTDNNRGKSHGARIIYFYGSDQAPLYLIAAYAKSKQVDKTAAAKKAARKLVEVLKRAAPDERRRNLRVISSTKSSRR